MLVKAQVYYGAAVHQNGYVNRNRNKIVFLAPIAGQSASIMALLFIKMDILSATGIEKIFLAPIAEIHYGSKDIKRKSIHLVKMS